MYNCIREVLMKGASSWGGFQFVVEDMINNIVFHGEKQHFKVTYVMMSI